MEIFPFLYSMGGSGGSALAVQGRSTGGGSGFPSRPGLASGASASPLGKMDSRGTDGETVPLTAALARAGITGRPPLVVKDGGGVVTAGGGGEDDGLSCGGNGELVEEDVFPVELLEDENPA